MTRRPAASGLRTPRPRAARRLAASGGRRAAAGGAHMTGSMIGADVDALRTLAAEFERDADRLSVLADGLGASLQSVHWAGADAARAGGVAHRGQPRIRAAADRLRQAAADLRWQAEEQGAASAAATASALAARAMGPSAPPGQSATPARPESGAVADLRAAADSGSPATVAAAWRKLSASERESLIRDDAGLVGNLDGVPASARRGQPRPARSRAGGTGRAAQGAGRCQGWQSRAGRSGGQDPQHRCDQGRPQSSPTGTC